MGLVWYDPGLITDASGRGAVW
jgi:L-serine kinase (ATP) / ParB family transcriptional regulator, heme-responsive regulator